MHSFIQLSKGLKLWITLKQFCFQKYKPLGSVKILKTEIFSTHYFHEILKITFSLLSGLNYQ